VITITEQSLSVFRQACRSLPCTPEAQLICDADIYDAIHELLGFALEAMLMLDQRMRWLVGLHDLNCW